MLNLTRLHLGIAHESQFQGLGLRRLAVALASDDLSASTATGESGKGILRDFNAPPGRGPRRDACLSASQHLLHRRRRVRLASASEVTLCGQRLRYLPIAAVRATRAPAPLPPAPERRRSDRWRGHRPRSCARVPLLAWRPGSVN